METAFQQQLEVIFKNDVKGMTVDLADRGRISIFTGRERAFGAQIV